jgi:integral membrane protein (TIGR01906 family)
MKIKYFLIILIPLLLMLTNLNFIIFHNSSSSEVNENIINYLKNKEDLKFNFTQEETIHMKDVKSLISKLNYIILILLLLIIIILIVNKENISKQLIISGAIPIVLIVLLYFIDFNSLFITLHKLLFTNNYWLLPSNSLLIQTYPQEFFMNISKRLSLNIIFSSLIITTIGIFQNVYSQHKPHPD